MKLLKIEINSKARVEVKYETDYTNDNQEADLIDIKCPNAAPITLIDAINRLKTHVINICELPKKYVNEISIKGIEFSYKSDVVGVKFIVCRELKRSKAPLTFDSPQKFNVAKDVLNQLPKGCWEVIEEVTKEVRSFINQRSQQLSLFSELKKVI